MEWASVSFVNRVNPHDDSRDRGNANRFLRERPKPLLLGWLEF